MEIFPKKFLSSGKLQEFKRDLGLDHSAGEDAALFTPFDGARKTDPDADGGVAM